MQVIQQADVKLERVNDQAMLTIKSEGILVSVPLDAVRDVLEDRYRASSPFRIDDASWNRAWNTIVEDVELRR